MGYEELIGYYTYRSFLDNPLPVNDFNNIKSVEAELFLIIHADGIITGTLSFPAEPGASEKLFMDIIGNVKRWPSPITLEFKAKGRPNTAIFDYLYEYSCSVTHRWEKDNGQRLALTGTVLRSQDHGLENQIAETSVTASFVAVKRDFHEPRDINGVAIIPSALSMLASKSHRLMHTVWHTIRARGIWYGLNEENKTTIRNLGWGLDRPPFDQNRELNLSNGAGEDFLFMHRKMITMVRDKYNSQGAPYIESWKSLPPPSAQMRFPSLDDKTIVVDTQQFFYSEQDDPQNPGKNIYRFNIRESGNMVPPAYLIPSEDKEEDLRFFRSLKLLKSSDYFNNVMSRLERIFKNKTFLVTISLGALGNLIEFEIHNQMHMRWSSTPRDPESGEPAERGPFDFDNKWDDPKYDYLGDFYSSHVHPLFWKLHGWVDDRIEDWFNAHEAIHPGEIERYEYQGVKWFKPGKWVQVSKPFYWPEHQHHDHGNDQQQIDAMLKVMEIIRILVEGPGEARDRFIQPEVSKITSFMRDIMPEK